MNQFIQDITGAWLSSTPTNKIILSEEIVALSGSRYQLKGGEANFSFCKVWLYSTCIMQNQPIFDYFNINIMSGHKCTTSGMNIIQIWGSLTAPLNVNSPKIYQRGAATI